MGWFSKKPSLREERITAVLKAWNVATEDVKEKMRIEDFELYSALVWLAAHEVVIREIEQRARSRYAR